MHFKRMCKARKRGCKPEYASKMCKVENNVKCGEVAYKAGELVQMLQWGISQDNTAKCSNRVVIAFSLFSRLL